MSRILLSLAAGILLLFSRSCDTSFNPSAPFQPRLVVYSVLTTESDTQYVRVYTTYNSSDNGASNGGGETAVTDAQVTVSQGAGATMTFQPTVIEYRDSSGSLSSVDAYSAYPFRPEAGKQYILTVSSPACGTATATITVPGQGLIEPINAAVLGNPFNIQVDFGFRAALAPEAMGFLGQIYIEYLRRLPDGTYQPERFQIPSKVDTISVGLDLYRYSYPQPTRRSTAPTPHQSRGGLTQFTEGILYSWVEYTARLRWLFESKGNDIKFSRAVFYLIQFDRPLWSYWNASNGFHDKLSIRLDDPDYTDISGGAGVLGSVTVDSLVWALPETIPHPPSEVIP
jgi:hypothetical protein